MFAKMASVRSSTSESSSSDSTSTTTSSGTKTKILDRYSCRTGPVPYGFHPVCDRRDRSPSPASASGTGASISDTDSDDSVSGPGEFPLSPDGGSRIGNTEWCSCGKCGPMCTTVESLCCQEVAAILHRMPEGEGSCVTDANDFAPVCINRAVLDVGLLSMYHLRANSLIQPIASR